MAISVSFTEDPAEVLSSAGDFLASRPVLHNLILTLLHARVARTEPGRYWVAKDGGTNAGVVFQSPTTIAATLTPMEREVVVGVVDAIADQGVRLPGVNGDATTAACFAGAWTERCKCAAIPFHGQRIYEVVEVTPPLGVAGKLRKAGTPDRDLAIAWTRAFQASAGEHGTAEVIVDRLLSSGQLFFWDDGEPKSMAAHREPVEGVARVQGVYTPPELRGRGYAAACVAELSQRIRSGGLRCILYTDLGNATSNSIYRRIGYRAVAEGLRYRFE